MNTAHLFFSSPITQTIGWILLHSLWQGAFIALGLRFAQHLLPNASAQGRYAAACFALGLMCVAPVCTVLLGGSPLTPIAFQSVPANHAEIDSVRVVAPTAPFSPGPSSQSAADLLNKLTPFVTATWLAGVSVFSVRMTRGWLQLRSLRLAATEPVPPDWLERLADLRCRLEIIPPVLLMQSALVQVPTVIGWLRPIILFPVASISNLTPDQLDAILAHELAHIRRHDFLVNFFQCLAETLFFYHPMVWWVSGCIREERENCCDDLVIAVCDDNLAYAQALARLEESRSATLGFAFAATGGSLLNRIRRLLGAPAPDTRLGAPQFCGAVLLAIGLLAIGTGVYFFFERPITHATTRISYEMETSTGSPVPANGFRPEPSQVFLQTQSEMIQSATLMRKVIKDLDLENVWAKRTGTGKSLAPGVAVAQLRRMTTVHAIPNTTLIDITVSSTDPEEAAKIANSIANEYRNQQIQRYSESTEYGIATLETAWAKQAKKIQEQTTKVEQLDQELGFADEAVPESVPSPETIRRLSELRLEKETQFITEQALLTGLTNLPPAHLKSVLPTAVPDGLLNALTQQLNLAQQHLLALNADYGPNHPECLKVREQISDLEKKISDRIEGIMLGLQKRVDSLQEGLKKLQEETQKAAANEAERKRKLARYTDAKRRLEELERFGQALSMKIASEKIDSQQPETVPQIVESAVPVRSTSTTRSLAFPLIIIGILLDAFGLGLLRFSPPLRV